MKIRFVSLVNAVTEALLTFKRYPAPVLFAVITSILSMIIFEHEYDNVQKLVNIALLTALGVPLTYGIHLYLKEKKLSDVLVKLLPFASILLLGLLYLTLPPEEQGASFSSYYRVLIYLLAAHLFVAVAPWLHRTEPERMWQFNIRHFTGFLSAAVLSLIIYIGIAFALLSLDVLLEVNFSDDLYFHSFMICAGIIHPLFFFGFVHNAVEESSEPSYPKALYILSRYVLIPLVLLYFVIVYLYAVKITLEWSLPEGKVAWLISGIAAAGIFTRLLTDRWKESEQWSRLFAKWFFPLLLPLTVLLAIATWVRVEEYGITENRYYLLLEIIWLFGISIYSLISHRASVKVIPLTMLALLLITSAGPWGAFSVSESSQRARLISLFEEHQLLVDGQYRHRELDDRDASYEITSIARYLDNDHSLEPLAPLFKEAIDSVHTSQDSAYVHALSDVEIITELLIYNTGGYRDPVSKDVVRYSFTSQIDTVHAVEGFDYAVRLNVYTNDDQRKMPFAIGGDTFNVDLLPDNIVAVNRKDSAIIRFDLQPGLDSLAADNTTRTHGSGDRPLQVESLPGKAAGRLYLQYYDYYKRNDRFFPTSLTGELYLRLDK